MDALLVGLKAAAEPTRLRILALCAHGELSVSDITQILGQSQPRVSRHLKLLGDAGRLGRCREGTFAYYRLAKDGDAAALAQALVDLIPGDDPVYDRDLERLETLRQARAEQAKRFFEENAAQWDRLRALHIADAAVEQAILDRAPDRIGVLLDLGCGTGRMLELLGPRARRGVGIDRSREMLSVARSNLDTPELRHCEVRLGTLEQLPLPDAGFDLAILHHVLHFLEQPPDSIQEAARVLKPGGRLIIVDFAPHHLEELGTTYAHRWMGFDGHDIARWLAAAGLREDGILELPGAPLTVAIWTAGKP